MTRTDTAGQLAEALRRRLEVIADRDLRERDPEAQLAALRDVSAKIDSLAEAFSGDPRMEHYLERRSFDKALAHLEEHYLKQTN